MMDPRDIFKNSDSVRLTQVSFDLITPFLAPGGTITRLNVCVTKAADELKLILNTQADLGLNFPQNIELRAELPLPTGQPPLVKWNVEEVGLNIPLGGGATLTGMKGALTTSFQEIAPRSLGFACDNITQRAVGVSFQTVGTQNQVGLFVTGGPLGDYRLQNIQLIGGTAAEPLNIGTFEVSISPRPRGIDPCSAWGRPGQAVWFDAIIKNLPSDAGVTFQWTVSGAMGGGTGPSVLVNLPNTETTVAVALTVTATELGQVSTKLASFSFTMPSPDQADAFERVCRLKALVTGYLQHNILLPGSKNRIAGFVDLWWDDRPFFRTDGIALSTESLRELFAATERLRIQSASVAMSLERVLSRGGETTMPPGLFRISGRTINQQTRQGVMGLRVEAWDKDLIFNDLVGSAMTDTEGAFRIEFSASHFQECFLDRRPDLFFKIFRGDALIHSTKDAVLWNVDSGGTPVVIAVE